MRTRVSSAFAIILLATSVACRDGNDTKDTGPVETKLPRRDAEVIIDSGEPPAPPCDATFINDRQNTAWYGQNGFPHPQGCSGKTQQVPRRRATTVYYQNAGNNWTQAAITTRLGEARQWFDRYCITVDFHDVALPAAARAGVINQLQRGDTGANAYASAVGTQYNNIWEHHLGKPKPLFLLLFVDDFDEVRYYQRIDGTSGVFASAPVILIEHHDNLAPTS